MLLSTSQVMNKPTALPEGMSGQVAPETGDFDFLNYLLGLQVSPETSENTEALGQLAKKEKTEEQQPLEQSAKEVALWNPLFPGLQESKVDGLLSANTPKENGDRSSSEVAGGISQSLPMLFAKEGSNLENAAKTEDSPADGAKALSPQQNLAFQRYTDSLKQSNGIQPNVSEGLKTPEQFGLSLSKEAPLLGEAALREEDVKADLTSRSMFNAAVTETNAQVKLDALEGSATKSTEVKHASIPEVMTKVESLVQSGGGKMTVSLNPPELGRVEIEVMTKGKRVEIAMTSEKEMTKSILESRFSELKQSMQVHDLQLSKMEVHVSKETSANLDQGHLSQNGGHQGFQNAQSQENNHQSRSFKSQREFTPRVSEVRSAPVMASRGSSGASGVDLRI